MCLSRQRGQCFIDRSKRALGGLAAEIDRFRRAMEVEEPDGAEPRLRFGGVEVVFRKGG